MSAGDNTLNAVTAMEMLKSMNKVDPELVKPDREVRAAVLEDYVKFMTTPVSYTHLTDARTDVLYSYNI